MDDDGCDVDMPADNDSLAEPAHEVDEQRDGMELRPESRMEKRPVIRPVKPVSNVGVFGSFGNEPMQSCSPSCVIVIVVGGSGGVCVQPSQ